MSITHKCPLFSGHFQLVDILPWCVWESRKISLAVSKMMFIKIPIFDHPGLRGNISEIACLPFSFSVFQRLIQPLASYYGLFLLPGQFLDSCLGLKRGFILTVFFFSNQCYRKSWARIFGGHPLIMAFQALFKVIGIARIISPIRAFDNVNKECPFAPKFARHRKNN